MPRNQLALSLNLGIFRTVNSVDSVVPGGGGGGEGEKNTPYNGLRLNPAYTNIKGAVRVNRVEFTENVRTFVPQGQEKLSVISRCP